MILNNIRTDLRYFGSAPLTSHKHHVRAIQPHLRSSFSVPPPREHVSASGQLQRDLDSLDDRKRPCWDQKQAAVKTDPEESQATTDCLLLTVLDRWGRERRREGELFLGREASPVAIAAF